jgi:L-alanine-DL-glutamate epimerase-like enolase superfamily enzyme
MRKLTVTRESWPIAGTFTISRGSKTAADVVVVTLEEDGVRGRGECVPYSRYHETVDGVVEALEKARKQIEADADRNGIAAFLSPKAARNALDCALWDLEAKKAGKPVWRLAGLSQPKELVTAYTISLDTAEAMTGAVAKAASRPLLKLKLGRDGDTERLKAIRKAAPESRLIVDANEGWTPENLASMLEACAEAGVELVEQPLPSANDEALRHVAHAVPICADESAHGIESLPSLAGKYEAINIKLDKTGGLTDALKLARAAQSQGFGIMTGCMLATSLAMAPAFLIALLGTVVDLDGPLLLAKDREPGIRYEGSLMFPPPPELWG